MNRQIRLDQEFRRFIKFLLVGAIGAIIDFGIMNLFTYIFSAPLVISGSISFACAVISNFVLNRFWTYPDSRSRTVAKHFFMFFTVNIIGILIRIPVLHFLEPEITHLLDRFRVHFYDINVLSKNITLAVTVIFILFWNFFINRIWTYNDVNKVVNET